METNFRGCKFLQLQSACPLKPAKRDIAVLHRHSTCEEVAGLEARAHKQASASSAAAAAAAGVTATLDRKRLHARLPACLPTSVLLPSVLNY